MTDVQEGRILIGGQDISRLRRADLRGLIAYVPQDPAMFHRTLRENIAFARPGATDAEIRQAAEAAHVCEFVDALPAGFDTLVGERGVKLSGGQRQRVALARAILRDAPILLLDEATSALDSESEGLVQQALWRLMEGRTAFVVAHRLSTVARMDRLIVLDHGRKPRASGPRKPAGSPSRSASTAPPNSWPPWKSSPPSTPTPSPAP
jgi:ATP-binding cassette subfamily B protein